MPGTGGHDEIFIIQLPPVVAQYHASIRIDPHDFREEHLGIRLLSDEPPNGRADVSRRERRRRYLIEERLKNMVIRAVDNRDVDRRMFQRAGCVESSEPAANDDYAR